MLTVTDANEQDYRAVRTKKQMHKSHPDAVENQYQGFQKVVTEVVWKLETWGTELLACCGILQ